MVQACRRALNCPPGAGERLDRVTRLMRRKGMDVGALIDAVAGGSYGPPRSYLVVDSAIRKLLEGKPRRWRRLQINDIVASRHRSSYNFTDELVVGCNDYPMIWDRKASEPERRAQLEQAIVDYEPADAFAPFTPREVALGADVGYLECLTWPEPTELREPPVRADMEPTDAPVLVVNGEFDDLTTPREGQLVTKLFPDARQLVGRNAGHVDALYYFDGPSAVEIRRFMRQTLND